MSFRLNSVTRQLQPSSPGAARAAWLLVALLLWIAIALSSGHQWVAGDALKPGYVYILQSRMTIHPPWQPPGTANPTHNPYWVQGGPIRVHERRRMMVDRGTA